MKREEKNKFLDELKQKGFNVEMGVSKAGKDLAKVDLGEVEIDDVFKQFRSMRIYYIDNKPHLYFTLLMGTNQKIKSERGKIREDITKLRKEARKAAGLLDVERIVEIKNQIAEKKLDLQNVRLN